MAPSHFTGSGLTLLICTVGQYTHFTKATGLSVTQDTTASSFKSAPKACVNKTGKEKKKDQVHDRERQNARAVKIWVAAGSGWEPLSVSLGRLASPEKE